MASERTAEQLVDELAAWVRSRALPEIEDKFDEGWEALRGQLQTWIADHGGPDDRAAK